MEVVRKDGNRGKTGLVNWLTGWACHQSRFSRGRYSSSQQTLGPAASTDLLSDPSPMASGTETGAILHTT